MFRVHRGLVLTDHTVSGSRAGQCAVFLMAVLATFTGTGMRGGQGTEGQYELCSAFSQLLPRAAHGAGREQQQGRVPGLLPSLSMVLGGELPWQQPQGTRSGDQ